MLRSGFKLRVAVIVGIAAVALAASCHSSDPVSESASAETSSEGSEDVGEDFSKQDGDFGALGYGGEDGNVGGGGKGRGCFEDARYCSATGQVQIRDPNNNCKFPSCDK